MELQEKKNYRDKLVREIVTKCVTEIKEPIDYAEVIANLGIDLLYHILIHTSKAEALEKVDQISGILKREIIIHAGENDENVSTDR
jgi:hypothetical protein